MASLTEQQQGKTIYLMAHHTFGRTSHTINTRITTPEASRTHAVIDWNDGQWEVMDVSRNGTWLNNTKLEKERRYPLKEGDTLKFGHAEAAEYLVADTHPPKDFLLFVDGDKPFANDIIPLDNYHLLPDEQTPELALYHEPAQSHWLVEYIGASNNEPEALYEEQLINIGSSRWQLVYNRTPEQTLALSSDETPSPVADYVFNMSQDEESTQLSISINGQSYDLGVRSHHYLTATLARYKARDIDAGIDPSEQGWVYTDMLANDLGLAETHVNIQIHRARKQVVEALHDQANADSYIERRGGKIRLGVERFTVMKGSGCDCSTIIDAAGASS